jgi:hypothetical protein
MTNPLAELNAYIRRARDAAAEPLQPGEVHDPEELASVRRFQRAWGSQLALAKFDEALARGPANAGPLNSHALVLRSLATMREISPEYLRRFLLYVETLQWLETAEIAPTKRKARKR